MRRLAPDLVEDVLTATQSTPTAIFDQRRRVGVDAPRAVQPLQSTDIDLEVLEVVACPLIWRLPGRSHRTRRFEALAGRCQCHHACAGAAACAGRLHTIRQDLLAWLEEREYSSLTQLRGSMSRRHVSDADAFERAHYVRAVGTFVPEKIS